MVAKLAEIPPATLRVAVVTETYPPEVNGVAVTLAQLVAALRRQNHEVRLVRPRQVADGAGASTPLERLVRGLPVPRYPHLRMGLPCGRELRESWSQWRPDLVHVATEGPLGWSALRAARALGIPVSSDFRTNFHAYSRHYGIGWLRRPILGYLRRFHNDAGLTMVPTRELRDELAHDGLQSLAVVGRGVDTQRFSPRHRDRSLRDRWGADDDTPVVTYVGRLAAEKNLGLVAESFAALASAVPAARCVVVGDGPERAALAARCPGAAFTGAKHGSELAAHYASSDLVLFPSVTETFGNVTLEAMACGVPVVAFAQAAAGWLIDSGVNGIAVPPAEPQAYVPAVVSLAQATDLRRAMGRRARLAVEPLGWDAIAAHVEGLWRELLAR